MSIKVRPLGVKCNIQCQYRYQNPQRDAGNVPNTFDLPRMKAALERAGSHFAIFGGEPLLVPEHVLEELWAFGLERFGTTASRPTARSSRIGTSISSGNTRYPSASRWTAPTIQRRALGRLRQAHEEATAKTHAAIQRLVREGLTPSLIVTFTAQRDGRQAAQDVRLVPLPR